MRKTALVALVLALTVALYTAPSARGQVPTPNPQTPVTTVPGTVQPPAPGAPAQTAVVTTTVPSPASPSHVPESAAWALGASLLMSYVTKKKWFSFLTPETSSRVKSAIGFGLALATAAGIHFAVSGSFLDSGLNISMTGLSADALKDVGFQWISQQAWYIGLVKGS